MRIKKIAVENLFGSLNHVVELNSDARVTIVLGANGIGKTHLLECVSALFSARLQRLVAVPFSALKVELDDDTTLRVDQRSVEIPLADSHIEETIVSRRMARRSERRTQVRRKLTIQLVRSDGSPATEPWEPSSRSERKQRGDVELPAWLEPVEFGYWLDQRSDRLLTTRELRVLYGHEEGAYDDLPAWFKATLERTSVRLIETQRLLRTHRKQSRVPAHLAENRAVQFAVRDLLEDLSGRVQTAGQRYNRQAAALDQSYVDRFLRYEASPEGAPDDLQQRLADIASRRSRLERLSLLDAEPSTQSAARLTTVTAEKRLALSLFASDMDDKLKALEPLADQLEKLLDIVNRKLANTSKKLVTDAAVGLVVETVGNHRLDLEQLSSGEQHELVLLYDLLFRVRRESLVLIDEPELSLHPAWQEEFADDLMAIAQAKEFDVVLATHSPYIVGSRTSLCVTLPTSKT